MPVVLGAAAALMFATDVTAQTNPDLSGTWTRVEDAGAAAAATGGRGGRGGRGGGGLGASSTLAQTATTLTITRTQGQNQVVSTYNLDGSPSSNTVQGRGGESTQTSTAVWTDGKLVIKTMLNFGGNAFEQTMTLSMAEGGLTVASMNPGRGGGTPTTTETKYTKG